MEIIKNVSYKSCHIRVRRDSKRNEYKVVVTDANGKRYPNSFNTELDATQWAVSKAEYCDRKAYDYVKQEG